MTRNPDYLIVGGGMGMTPQERLRGTSSCQPELASFNLGSMNFSMHPLADKYDDWKFDWEEAYLRNSDSYIFRNTFADIVEIRCVPFVNENYCIAKVAYEFHIVRDQYQFGVLKPLPEHQPTFLLEPRIAYGHHFVDQVVVEVEGHARAERHAARPT